MKSFDIIIEKPKPKGCINIYVDGKCYVVDNKGLRKDWGTKIKIQPNNGHLIKIPSAVKIKYFVLISGDFNKLYAAVDYYISSKNFISGEYVLRLMWEENEEPRHEGTVEIDTKTLLTPERAKQELKQIEE